MALRILVRLALPIHMISANAIANPTIYRRDDSALLPTFTLGPSGQYLDSPATTADPIPPGSSVVIYPTGVFDKAPEQGINVVFGPDAQKKVGEIIESHCKNNAEEQCRTELAKTLQQTDIQLHAKRFPVLVLAALGLVLSQLYVAYHLYNPTPPQAIHFNAPDLEQMNQVGYASTLAIATASNDPKIVTVTAPPSPTPTPQSVVSVTTMTVDGSDGKAGDVVINFPEGLNVRIEDFINMSGGPDVAKVCGGVKMLRYSKRVDVLTEDCLRNIANLANILVENENAFAQLVPANMPQQIDPQQAIPVPAVAELVYQEIPVYILVYRQARPRSRLADGALLALSALATTIVYLHAVSMADLQRQLKLSAGHVSPVKMSEDQKCDPDLWCVDEDCKGDLEALESGNAVCLEGKNRDCPCGESPQVFYNRWISSLDDLNSHQGFLQELIKMAESLESPPSCEEKSKLDVENAKFKEKFGKACKDHNELRRRNATSNILKRDEWEAKFDNEDGYSWKFSWKDEGACQLTCQDVFSKFLGATSCAYDSHTMAASGTMKTACGDASFEITKSQPVTPPKPDDSQWQYYKIDVHQEMEYSNSFIEWTLYAGATGYRLEGPSRESRVPNLGFGLQIFVQNPLNKEVTDVRFAISPKPEDEYKMVAWSTGTTKQKYTDSQRGDAAYGTGTCDGRVAVWIPKNAGFYRDFSCAFSKKILRFGPYW